MSETEEVDINLTETPDDYLDVQWVPRDAIEPNEWNPNRMKSEQRTHLARSIKNHGWTRPIVVHAEEMYIIDGEQRWTVSKKGSIQEDETLTPPDVPAGYVPVFGITVEESKAKVSTIQHNRVRGFIDHSSLYDWLGEFEQKDILNDVADEIDLDRSDVKRLVNQEEVADVVGGSHDKLSDSWEPTPITEVESGETVTDSRTEGMSEAEGDMEVGRITVQFRKEVRDRIEDVFGTEHTADNVIRTVNYIDEHDLVDEFREYADASRHREHLHPDHPFCGVHPRHRPADWDSNWDTHNREVINPDEARDGSDYG